MSGPKSTPSKAANPFRAAVATTADLVECFGVTKQFIGKLAADEIIEKADRDQWDAFDTVRRFTDYVRSRRVNQHDSGDAPLDVAMAYERDKARKMANLQAREPSFTALVESDPAYKILEVCAYRELIIRQRVNDASRAVMLAYATGSDLDQLGAIFNVSRLSSTVYSAQITITGTTTPDISSVLNQQSVDDFGRPTYTSDGKQFAPALGRWLLCYYDFGWRIMVFQDGVQTGESWLSRNFPLDESATPDLSDWSLGTAYGGATGFPVIALQAAAPVVIKESDIDFRRRIQLSLEGFSVAGPEGAYVFWALSASAAVLDVTATSPTPGNVLVTVLSRVGSGEADSGLLSDVYNAVNSDYIRPLTDQVEVHSAEIVPFEIEAQIFTYPGPDTSIVLDAAKAALATYADSVHKLGKDVSISGIYAALHRPGVQRVNLIQPTADISISPLQASFCSSTNVTIDGTDD
jgi:phage-related baseplate assembly protein